jgi:hypothetical protein
MNTTRTLVLFVLVFALISLVGATSVKVYVYEFDKNNNKVPVQGASISLDKVKKGSTDTRGSLTIQISPNGSHKISAKKIRGLDTLCGSISDVKVGNPRSGYAPDINIRIRKGGAC